MKRGNAVRIRVFQIANFVFVCDCLCVYKIFSDVALAACHCLCSSFGGWV